MSSMICQWISGDVQLVNLLRYHQGRGICAHHGGSRLFHRSIYRRTNLIRKFDYHYSELLGEGSSSTAVFIIIRPDVFCLFMSCFKFGSIDVKTGVFGLPQLEGEDSASYRMCCKIPKNPRAAEYNTQIL